MCSLAQKIPTVYLPTMNHLPVLAVLSLVPFFITIWFPLMLDSPNCWSAALFGVMPVNPQNSVRLTGIVIVVEISAAEMEKTPHCLYPDHNHMARSVTIGIYSPSTKGWINNWNLIYPSVGSSMYCNHNTHLFKGYWKCEILILGI